ncbi:MAG: hypothetical protein K0S32_3553 [Bacteroidetes bacterium]|nr:hypothetical protein [Bacteroidota bacterium]
MRSSRCLSLRLRHSFIGKGRVIIIEQLHIITCGGYVPVSLKMYHIIEILVAIFTPLWGCFAKFHFAIHIQSLRDCG